MFCDTDRTVTMVLKGIFRCYSVLPFALKEMRNKYISLTANVKRMIFFFTGIEWRHTNLPGPELAILSSLIAYLIVCKITVRLAVTG